MLPRNTQQFGTDRAWQRRTDIMSARGDDDAGSGIIALKLIQRGDSAERVNFRDLVPTVEQEGKLRPLRQLGEGG